MPDSPSNAASAILRRFAPLALGLLIVGVTFAIYWPALSGEYLWDDLGHVTRPDLRSLAGLRRIWFEIGTTQQYYPLLHSAFWLEHRLWGDATLGYHVVNVLLHASAACLFAAVLRRLAVPGAGLAALFFAVHPVCVESVAWISEQKNTLSAVLYLAAALAYLKWHGRPARECVLNTDGTPLPPCPSPALARERGRFTPTRRSLRSLFWYCFASFLFLCALLTKTVTATLPAALLVIVWWQRGRLGWRRDVVPLLPWLVAGAASGLLTAWFERKLIGAEGAEFELSLVERGLLAGRVVWFYLGKLLWPANLTFIYPRWLVDASVWWQWLFPLATALTLLLLWRLARSGSSPSRLGRAHVAAPPGVTRDAPTRPGLSALSSRLWTLSSELCGNARRAPLAVALLFGGTLFPVLGFFNVFPFLYSFVADHFQYLASLPIFAAAGTLFSRAVVRTPPRILQPWTDGTVIALVLVTLAGLSWRQSALYRDSFVLWETTLARNPSCWMAYNNLGTSHAAAGRHDHAVALYERSLALNPRNAAAENNYGNALLALGRAEEALAHFRRAHQLQPTLSPVHNNRGRALMELGRVEEGIAEFTQAVQDDPNDGDARYNLGLALARQGETARALPHLQRAAELRPGDAATHLNLAVALSISDRFAEAEPHFEQAVALNPSSAHAHFAYGHALMENGRNEAAVRQFETVLQLEPEFTLAHARLAELFRHAGRLDEAAWHELRAAAAPAN